MGDNPSSINAASLLELESTNKGLLLTRISDTTLINALTPPLGMLILVNNNLYIRGTYGWVMIQNVNQSDAKYYTLPSLKKSSVFFKGANNISSDSTNFSYDSTNKILTVGGWLASSVPGAQVSYTAWNPGTGYPRGHMNVGNSSGDINVGFVVAPLYSASGVQKTTFLEVSTNKLASDPLDKDLVLQVSGNVCTIGSESNNSESPFNYAGNPISFIIQQKGSSVSNSGLIINNDSKNTITIGSNTPDSTKGQLNVVHRNTLPAIYADNKISIGANSGTTGQILLNGSTSGTVTIQPAAIAGTWNLTLPSTTGTTGQVLQTDGSGLSSWTTVLRSSDTASMLSNYAKASAIPSVTGKVNFSDTASMLTNYRTGISTLTTNIGSKVNIGDTANMLSNYLSRINALTTNVAGKVNVSDTATMLTNYAKTSAIPDVSGKVNIGDTSNMLSNYLSRINTLTTNVAGKVNVSDTATMLTNYAKTSSIPNISGKVNVSDTANMLSPYAKTSSLQSLNGYEKYTDTASLVLPYLRKADTSFMLGNRLRISDTTSMLTNYRTGINTLTTNIASKVNIGDTTSMLSNYLSRVNALTTSKVNVSDTTTMLSNYARTSNLPSLTGYAKYSDTASMILPYLRRTDTAFMLSNRLKISDTTTMLSNYARTSNLPSLTGYAKYSDTASMVLPYLRKTDTAYMLSNRVKISDTANMLTPYQRISPIISSSVSGATVTYTAYNPGLGYPRGHMNIGNSLSDYNVGFVIAPTYANKPTFLEVSTYNVANTADKDFVMQVSPTQSTLTSESNNTMTLAAGNPIYFQIQPSNTPTPTVGLIVNNDVNTSTTIGSSTANTTAQLNVLHRSTLPAAWFDNQISVGANSGSTGQILLNGATSGTVTLQPGNTAGTWNLTLPTNTGTNGQVLQTDGTGATSWISTLKATDTASMLSNYFTSINTLSTAKVNVSDTLAMLSGYARSGKYIPYTGATTNVNLGTNSLTASSLTLTSVPLGTNTDSVATINSSTGQITKTTPLDLVKYAGGIVASDTASMLAPYAKTSSISMAVNGNAVATITAATYSIATTDKFLIYTGSSSSTFTLPTAVGVTGKEYFIKNMTSSNITLNTTSSQQIWFSSSSKVTTISIDGDNATSNWIHLISDGTHWINFSNVGGSN